MMYVEILCRVLLIMVYTILIIRWIGKRAVGGIDTADVLLVIAMGSSVGDAMLYPSIPLLVSIVVITSIAIVQKVYVYVSIKYETVRNIAHTTVVKIVEHGKLLIDNFEKDKIDKNEVLMLLRESGIEYLSEVEHAYYEQSGRISVFRYSNPIFIDSILPENMDKLGDDE